MPAQTTQLLLLDDLEDARRTGDLPAGDRQALQAVAEWVRSFVARPHQDLGRSGTVCPFVPGSLERKTLWLAPEAIGDAGPLELADLMEDYKRLLLATPPVDGDDAIYSTIMVVFPDLPAERAGALFNDVLGRIASSSYEEDGILFGPFYEGNPGSAIYNPAFHPFQSPVPFMFVRHTVVSDWKFFLEDDDALDRWARRFGASGARALAEQLRRVPWQGQHG